MLFQVWAHIFPGGEEENTLKQQFWLTVLWTTHKHCRKCLLQHVYAQQWDKSIILLPWCACILILWAYIGHGICVYYRKNSKSKKKSKKITVYVKDINVKNKYIVENYKLKTTLPFLIFCYIVLADQLLSNACMYM